MSIYFAMRRRGATLPREADWAETLRPILPAFGSTPPASLREMYQTFIGYTAMLELFLDHSSRRW